MLQWTAECLCLSILKSLRRNNKNSRYIWSMHKFTSISIKYKNTNNTESINIQKNYSEYLLVTLQNHLHQVIFWFSKHHNRSVHGIHICNIHPQMCPVMYGVNLHKRREYNNRCTLHPSLSINPLNAKLNPICHLLALLRAHHILHVSGIRVKLKKDLNLT
jgi:hypothetical protein